MKKKSIKSKERIGFVDEVRGLAILLMVVYHLFFDLVFIYGINIPIFYSSQMNLIRDIFAGLFIFISGSACRLSHNNLKRGVLCFLCGMLITVVTYVVIPEDIVRFGILHMLGISMILFFILQKPLDKIRFPIIGILIFSFLFLITFHVRDGQLGPFTLPNALYQTSWLYPLGFPSASFFSSDYFPLIPWLFLFLAGSYFGIYLKEHRLPRFFYKTHISPLAYVGRHTLIIYLAHQPILYGALYVIFYFVRN